MYSSSQRCRYKNIMNETKLVITAILLTTITCKIIYKYEHRLKNLYSKYEDRLKHLYPKYEDRLYY